ncbi:VNG_1110C family protein [Natronorubrum bangense]|uniref:Uncharacterized protein n=2 Tax=Natronorubrum bangense TaxID=61858 RepID=L9W690_9EURY|nr:hypothetical protein [Natronorubrum bangense]ELY44872.1 hypothetical protein C494_16453 [Natronorubrum bangense JCM 10635]QCC55035.1 hypothetical protein DV706_11480 [Natronorubrum bangense]
MPDATQLRDSTQIVLHRETVEGLEPPLDEAFTVSIVAEGEDRRRIIGSPVEIKAASESLARRGICVR